MHSVQFLRGKKKNPFSRQKRSALRRHKKPRTEPLLGGRGETSGSGECHSTVVLSYFSWELLEKPSVSSNLLFSYGFWGGEGGLSILLPSNSSGLLENQGKDEIQPI